MSSERWTSDSRAHEIRVAGPAALLVAKTIKIEDRLRDATHGNPQRIVDKDALDVFRLLQACPRRNWAQGWRATNWTPLHTRTLFAAFGSFATGRRRRVTTCQPWPSVLRAVIPRLRRALWYSSANSLQPWPETEGQIRSCPRQGSNLRPSD